MIYHVYLENDGPDGMSLVLEGDEGSHVFQIGDDGLESLDNALNPYRMMMLEKEVVRAERAAAGNVSWQEYQCPDPEGEWAEMLREQADVLRKRDRENRDA